MNEAKPAYTEKFLHEAKPVYETENELNKKCEASIKRIANTVNESKPAYAKNSMRG